LPNEYRWPGNVRELKNAIERLILRNRTGVLTLADLPAEIQEWGRAAPPPPVNPALTPSSIADELFDRMIGQGESFWTVIHPMFMARDLTRADLKAILRKGLQQTGGNYKVLVQLFNKRFLNFLRKHECHVPFRRFRTVRPSAEGTGATLEDV
jgi:DNA-binding NtrC family response regulator